ncbi:hypothetical protein NYE70_02100 [Paenibacillus sp. FSL R5-0407]|uniref:hypothetical protein n=1 Tax=Paenibacillus sp. FSL R5-0407 TaxID=2975320 RepID=UPI0030F4B4F4
MNTNIKSSFILGASIIIGFILLGLMQGLFREEETVITEKVSHEGRYEFIRAANDNNVIIFDKETGEYWRKFISVSEGPTDWTKEESPVTSSK